MTLDLFPPQEISPLHHEERARARGFRHVAGVDEAGRGPLAGPVVAAAVLLPEDFDLPGLNDSKQVAAHNRERLFDLIRQQALAIGIGVSSPKVIDSVNILEATLRGMALAVKRMRQTPDFLLVDGTVPVPVPLRQQTLRQGDSLSPSIAAASIIAKVVRDRIMRSYDRLYPHYGFGRHKGYGSAEHRSAIAKYGPSSIHRLSFAGVREYIPS